MFAHAVEPGALPAPPWLLAYLGIALVLGTAAALRVTWPRAGHAPDDPPLPDPPSVGPFHIVGLVLYAATTLVALFGSGSAPANVAFWLALVVWWIGLPFVCLLGGDVMRAINPFLPVVAVLDRGRRRPVVDEAGPAWTAAAFLAVWTWYLLAYHRPDDPRTVGYLLLAYGAAAVAGGLRWGRRWLVTGEAFGAISASTARVGLRPRGRRWSRAAPGTAALMVVWIGGTSFDAFTSLPFWIDVLGTSREWTRTMLDTVGLAWLTAIVAGAYLVVVRVAERQRREGDDAPLAQPLSPGLVPLAVGWFLGHDLTLLLLEGQNAYALISDPLGRGWDLFGTYSHTIDYTLATRGWVTWTQLVLLAGGHVLAVVVLHERGLQRLPARGAMRTTWVMAAVTSASITAAALLVLG